MSYTQEFQNEVISKMNIYFEKKITAFLESDTNQIVEEYDKQYSLICHNYENKAKRFVEFDNCEVLVRGLSEPSTYYTNDDLLGDRNLNSIYSPRIDLSFSPSLKLKRNKYESIGVYKLSEDVNLFDMVHEIEFVKEIEKCLREKSNQNMRCYNLPICKVGHTHHDRYRYPNKRPLHLFGIEIENQLNSKHLMGDFFNAINLSLIPIVIVPEAKMENLMNMLKYNKVIEDLKQLPLFKILNFVMVLSVNDFRDILNSFLREEGIETIGVDQYY